MVICLHSPVREFFRPKESLSAYPYANSNVPFLPAVLAWTKKLPYYLGAKIATVCYWAHVNEINLENGTRAARVRETNLGEISARTIPPGYSSSGVARN